MRLPLRKSLSGDWRLVGSPSQALLVTIFIALARAAAMAQGDPPLLTDNPETPGNRHWEISVGFTHEGRGGLTNFALPLLDIDYGLGDRLGINYEVPWLLQTSSPGASLSALGDSEIGVKWRFLDHEEGVSISVFPQLSVNSPGPAVRRGLCESGAELFLPLEISRSFRRFQATAEVGYVVSQHGDDEWEFGLALGRQVLPRLELLAEVHGAAASRLSSFSDLLVNGGGRFQFQKHMSLLFSVGHGLQPSGPGLISYFGLQLTY